MQKQSVRRQCIKSRNSLTANAINKASVSIKNRTIALLKELRPKVVHIYASINDEPKTHQIINWLLANRIDVYVAVVNNGDMYCKRLDNTALIKTNATKVLRGDITRCEHDILDIAIVPMLGFDLQMNRLGYGGGYYDRLLRTHTIPMTIGLCYEMNKYTAIPIEEHDIKMNYIITELKCYKPASPPSCHLTDLKNGSYTSLR